jgi:hypothetical protein
MRQPVANVIVVVKDERIRRQVELFLNQLEMEDLRFATFKSQTEFQELYFRDAPEPAEPAGAEADAAGDGAEETEGAELKLFSEIHLLIFATDAISEKPGAWIDSLIVNLKKYKHYPETQHLRLVLLKYEDDGVHKLDLLHGRLDDLIYLPLDRLVFLQKLQILLALPKLTSPTFLFNQEVNQGIEISKLAKIDRLSDVGLAIRNPVALKRGLPGHFYVQLPGEKTRLEVNGKVLRSEPHPEYPGEFLVYFAYFGLRKNDLSMIRRALSKSSQYKSLLHDDREKFRYRPDDLFVEEANRHIFGAIIIDTDENGGNSLAQTLTKDMDRLEVVTESSYSLFLHRYLESGGANASTTPPRATEESEFYSTPVTLTVGCADLGCLSVNPGPADDQLFLGHPAHELFSSPDKWLSLIREKESRLIMEEAALLVSRGRALEKLLAVQDAQGQRAAVNFKITAGDAAGTMAVEMRAATLGDIMDRMTSEQKRKNIEAMIVDAGFVPEDPSAWAEGLRLRAAQVGLVPDPKSLKFWLLSETEKTPADWLNKPEILGLYFKPVDHRQILFSLSENLPNGNTVYNFENLGWTQPALNAHVAKEVDLEALSEFGATLRLKQKLSPGTVIYLRKSIYDNAPNGCLAARVYFCQEHPKEKGCYQIFTTYFGINDAFLKFARTWIRENYAQQKGQANG